MSLKHILGSLAMATALTPAFAIAGTLIQAEPHVPRVTASGSVNLGELASRPMAHVDVITSPSMIRMPPRRLRWPGRVTVDASALPHTPATISRIVRPGKETRGFVGTYDGSNSAAIGGELEPPDQGLAANNGKVVEIINNSVQIFDSTGKAFGNPVSTSTFFDLDSSTGASDPHVEFDASTQRWFVEELIYSNTFNGFALAVSSSSDPRGTYIIYKISDDSDKIKGCAGSCFPDYPQVGYDQNGFYIAGDLFSNVTGNFVAAAVYALPKAVLVAGGPLAYKYFVLPDDFVVQPSIPVTPGAYATGANGTEFLLTARNIDDSSDKLRVFAITNTNAIGDGTGNLTIGMLDLAAEPYTNSVPSTEPKVVGPYGQSLGATTSPTLDGGYNAFGGGVKYLNGELYAALDTGALDSNGLARDTVAWFKVKAAATTAAVTASITAQGYIVPPDGYSLSYPGIALNGNGQGLIGMTITGATKGKLGSYPSAGYVVFTGKGTGPAYVVTGQGAATDDGFTGYGGSGPAGTGRWGDYSSATTDPVTGTFYVGNEFIPNADVYPRGTYANWGTFITAVKAFGAK